VFFTRLLIGIVAALIVGVVVNVGVFVAFVDTGVFVSRIVTKLSLDSSVMGLVVLRL
jgi:hypothetical protein